MTAPPRLDPNPAPNSAAAPEATPAAPAATSSSPPWHTLSAPACALQLGVESAPGLSPLEAAQRLQQHGANKLAEPPPRPLWRGLLDQFKSMLIIILLVAAVLAAFIGDFKSVTVILVVVCFNAVLGFWQEYRAEKTLAALKKMLAPLARVRRSGRVEEIEASTLVPGDVVLLEAGDRVPADGRLLAAHNVEIDEAALTGESHTVGKDAAFVAPLAAPLGDRLNMAFMNTGVTRGRAELLVTGTGMGTEMGRLADMLAKAETGATPLQKQIDGLARKLVLIAAIVVTVIFTLGMWRGDELANLLLTSLALAVAATPDGLPAVLTVTLALGMFAMAQHRAIVKRMTAVETLGCTTVICSDKTGTLTLNQMSARSLVFRQRRFTVSGEGYTAAGLIAAADAADRAALPDFLPLLHPAALANDSRIRDGRLIGDPTEGALLALAAKGGVDAEALAAHNPRIAEIPFDSAHKFQATFHHDGEWVRMYVKGAPDVLLTRASRQLSDVGEGEGEAALDAAFWQTENERLASQAMRVLAVATKTLPARDFDPAGELMQHAQELTLVGLVGLIDPPRPEAREAIAQCQHAGIQVKMITGDHRITAAAIARELGLHGEVIEGRELDALSVEALAARIDRIAVFARVAPEHKVRIVQALKADGHVTAMTGDGVNDAPALKHADIGVAMGITGTEVTKEAAVMVLTDDNFATIVRAVREGRAIYDNIVKFVRFQVSTNIGAMQTVLGASLLGLPTPFTAVQILWVNIIMDGPPALSLGVEPPRTGVMDEPPRRPDARILSGSRIAQLFFYGFCMTVGTLALFWYAQPKGETYALTLAWTTFVLFQFFNLFNARNEHGTAFNRQLFTNRWLWMSLGVVIPLQILVVHWGPLQAFFNTTDLSLHDWLLATAVAASVLVLEEARKLGLRLWRGGKGRGAAAHTALAQPKTPA
ncbi:cation transport ATPase [Serpentinimonas raichei]|uniref:Cation transport ATPase n=1 Tax=Serpentinimonas raichei TaxID=1458425 RepID=A0A060NM04_9BURK|nr:HAD-IC family P-type ATPase [Serpentinimonas raichei]BAO80558.1 cation transport ATPase [Serpentinimonas raichei]